MLNYRRFMGNTLEYLLTQHGGLITRRQASAQGLDPHLLTRWVRAGKLERIQRGVYRRVDAPPQPFEDLLEVALRIPYAVVCLRSALAFHGLTTYIPKAVDIAVPQKSKPPRLEYPPLQIHYFSESPYRFGVVEHDMGGHTVKVYSVEKTLADLLRFSGVYGDDLFAEGLKNYASRPKPKPDYPGLLEAARAGRVERRLKPILRVLAHDLST